LNLSNFLKTCSNRPGGTHVLNNSPEKHTTRRREIDEANHALRESWESTVLSTSSGASVPLCRPSLPYCLRSLPFSDRFPQGCGSAAFSSTFDVQLLPVQGTKFCKPVHRFLVFLLFRVSHAICSCYDTRRVPGNLSGKRRCEDRVVQLVHDGQQRERCVVAAASRITMAVPGQA
jgi:hypothetical protein